MSNRKRPEITDSLVKWYSKLGEGEINMMKMIFFSSPIVLVFLLRFFGFNIALTFIIMAMAISIMSILYSVWVLAEIMKEDPGTESMIRVASFIQEGAQGYFVAQYGTIFRLSFLFCVIISLVYYFREPPSVSSITQSTVTTVQGISNFAMATFSGFSFLFGALCSAFSGYAGMWVSVRANTRVCSTARRCYDDSIQIAFKGGYFGAVINIALAIFGISFMFLMLYIYFSFTVRATDSALNHLVEIPLLLIGYGFGASFVAMFAQLGGGIYTKAADVGADLIGKVEAGIPQDDPRNPAVIADLVGDNVGDCAGQAADLFESITAEVLSAMILGATLSNEAGFSLDSKVYFMFFPLSIHCLDIVVSTIGMHFVRTKKGLPDLDMNYGELQDPLDVMKKGYRVSMFLGITGFITICYLLLNPEQFPNAYFYFSLCGLIGVLVSYFTIQVTQYYTDYNYAPVQSIVFASKTGHATNIIAGMSVGLQSTGMPVIIISIALISAYYLGQATGIVSKTGGAPIGGLFGTAIATMGMFCTGVFILSMSGFGPIADNAGGIAEMSEQPPAVRKITDKLDAVGNVTKANAKGYSIGSASLACFLLFGAFIDEVNYLSPIAKIKIVDITVPEVFVGGLLGGMVVFVFTSWAMKSVGNAAQDVIKEVRRQFRENPDILLNKALPNYKQCVEIVARAGLREMIKPGLLAVLSPIVVGLIFKYSGIYQGKELLGAKVLCAFLMFSTSTGILMALFLNNAGGAWDNAQKYVESGALGGKGSDVHQAAVTGDTVGDPCQDTAGPSIHILIKLLSTITLVLAPLFID